MTPANAIHDRGDRMAPKRSNRIHCSLLILLDRLTYLLESDMLPSGDSLLDYGCGNKPYESLFRQKFANYIGADIEGNQDADLLIDSNGRVQCGDDSFDCVLSSQVLEHVISPQQYLREAHRVLKPGGSLVLSTHGIWPYHPDPTDFWRWTVTGLQKEIRLAAFDVMSIEGVMGLETAALQLWQDSTYDRIPSFLQRPYAWFFQSLIHVIERRRRSRLCDDAMLFVILARKPGENVEGDGKNCSG